MLLLTAPCRKETRHSTFILHRFTIFLWLCATLTGNIRGTRADIADLLRLPIQRKKQASRVHPRYLLRLLSWRMTLAKEMLVTHSSSFLMFLGSTVWHRCLGSMVRFTSGILLLRCLYLQSAERKIPKSRWWDHIIVLIIPTTTTTSRDISFAFVRMRLRSHVDLRCFCCRIGWTPMQLALIKILIRL